MIFIVLPVTPAYSFTCDSGVYPIQLPVIPAYSFACDSGVLTACDSGVYPFLLPLNSDIGSDNLFSQTQANYWSR